MARTTVRQIPAKCPPPHRPPRASFEFCTIACVSAEEGFPGHYGRIGRATLSNPCRYGKNCADLSQYLDDLGQTRPTSAEIGPAVAQIKKNRSTYLCQCDRNAWKFPEQYVSNMFTVISKLAHGGLRGGGHSAGCHSEIGPGKAASRRHKRKMQPRSREAAGRSPPSRRPSRQRCAADEPCGRGGRPTRSPEP